MISIYFIDDTKVTRDERLSVHAPLGGEVAQATTAADLWRRGAYKLMATVEGDMNTAYRLMQNGVVTDSWTLDPPKGLTPIAPPVVHNGQTYGNRSAMMGDIMVKDNEVYLVAAFGFTRLDLTAPTVLVTDITYFGQRCRVVCDRRCEKAFGINTRPSIRDEQVEDDVIWLADDEVPNAPTDPGTYEGGDAKPFHPARHNKWCVRECERSSIIEPGRPLRYPDWSERRYNMPDRHGRTDNPFIEPKLDNGRE